MKVDGEALVTWAFFLGGGGGDGRKSSRLPGFMSMQMKLSEREREGERRRRHSMAGESGKW